MRLERSAGHHRGDRQPDVARERDDLFQRRRPDKTFLAGRTQRMHEHGCAKFFSRREEWRKPRITDRTTVDVGGDLDTGQPERADNVLQFRDRPIQVLQRYRAQAKEPLRMLRDHRRQGIVQMPHQHLRVRRGQPVREQFGHRREHLARDAHRVHLGTARSCVPAGARHRAIALAGNHHVRVAAFVLHRGPGEVGARAGHGRERFRHEVRMDIDAGHQRAEPACTSGASG